LGFFSCGRRFFGLSPFLILFFLIFNVFNGCQQQFDPRDIQDPANQKEESSGNPLDSLLNTRWVWNSPWGGRSLFFCSDDTVIYIDQAEGEYTESYTYNGSTKKGEINYYGKFEISSDNKTMHFIEWKNYGHGSDFDLVIEQAAK
jgi:hypothetical protein